jgi:hypothetical protein
MKLGIYSSASIVANSLLYVRPSSWCFKFLVCVHRGGVCPGSVGTRQALLQGWLLCFDLLCLVNVPDLVSWPWHEVFTMI